MSERESERKRVNPIALTIVFHILDRKRKVDSYLKRLYFKLAGRIDSGKLKVDSHLELFVGVYLSTLIAAQQQHSATRRSSFRPITGSLSLQ